MAWILYLWMFTYFTHFFLHIPRNIWVTISPTFLSSWKFIGLNCPHDFVTGQFVRIMHVRLVVCDHLELFQVFDMCDSSGNCAHRFVLNFISLRNMWILYPWKLGIFRDIVFLRVKSTQIVFPLREIDQPRSSQFFRGLDLFSRVYYTQKEQNLMGCLCLHSIRGEEGL